MLVVMKMRASSRTTRGLARRRARRRRAWRRTQRQSRRLARRIRLRSRRARPSPTALSHLRPPCTGQGRIGRATGARRRGVGTTRPGSGGCCRMASAFPNPADAWATTWARILDLCADVNGAPFVRTPLRRSWGRGPSPQGWRRIQARRSTCLLCELCSVDGPSPWSWGRFIIASTPCFCVGIGDQHSGIVRLFEVV